MIETRNILAVALSCMTISFATMSLAQGAGGLPSTWQPWSWNGYQEFPSLYFAAEPDGFLESEQMAKIDRFSLAILEFRAGQFAEEETTGFWAGGDLSGFMDQQIGRMHAQNGNNQPILTYRSGMWAGSMFDRQWQALQDQTLFLGDERHCGGFIDYPRDVNESGEVSGLTLCRWDFRREETRNAFRQIMRDTTEPNSNGVFFDNALSVACDDSNHVSRLSRRQRRDFMQAQLVTYRAVFADLVNAGRYPILSTTIGYSDIGDLVPWENDCPLGESAVLDALDGVPFARNNEFWMWNLGDIASRQIRNTIRETEAGVPVIVHMPYFPRDGGCLEGCRQANGAAKTFTQDTFLEFGIAAFLVSMGPGSYFGFSDMQSDEEGGGWFDISWDHFAQYDQIVTGEPIGVAIISADGMSFTRMFQNGRVSVNAATGDYAFDLVGFKR